MASPHEGSFVSYDTVISETVDRQQSPPNGENDDGMSFTSSVWPAPDLRTVYERTDPDFNPVLATNPPLTERVTRGRGVMGFPHVPPVQDPYPAYVLPNISLSQSVQAQTLPPPVDPQSPNAQPNTPVGHIQLPLQPAPTPLEHNRSLRTIWDTDHETSSEDEWYTPSSSPQSQATPRSPLLPPTTSGSSNSSAGCATQTTPAPAQPLEQPLPPTVQPLHETPAVHPSAPTSGNNRTGFREPRAERRRNFMPYGHLDRRIILLPRSEERNPFHHPRNSEHDHHHPIEHPPPPPHHHHHAPPPPQPSNNFAARGSQRRNSNFHPPAGYPALRGHPSLGQSRVAAHEAAFQMSPHMSQRQDMQAANALAPMWNRDMAMGYMLGQANAVTRDPYPPSAPPQTYNSPGLVVQINSPCTFNTPLQGPADWADTVRRGEW